MTPTMFRTNTTTSPDRHLMSNRNEDTDDDIPTEIDFSGGQRGKFYRKSAALATALGIACR